MTILPKKKNSQQKSENENSETSGHSHFHGERHGHPNHLQPENRDRFSFPSRTSPPTWPIQASREDKRPAHSVSSNFEDYENVESGPSHSKRRHRASPHRITRKSHNRDNHTHNLGGLLLRNNASPNFTTPGPSQAHARPQERSSNSSIASDEAQETGYNSEDEYDRPEELWTAEELEEREILFEKKLIKKGYVIKKMGEDGACLFRAVADQVYGDQEMHSTLRNLCIDYMGKNSDYFSHYVTEDFEKYLERKRSNHIHGNHVEMQALSEMFNRPIEVYHYGSEPINIFHGINTTAESNDPIRLSYHRNVHYNSIVDPYKPTIGVGLGLPAFKPGLADLNLIKDAIKTSEQTELEQAMLEDKLRATDWEATNDSIEEQVARESYLQWLRENELRERKKARSATATSSSSLEGTGVAISSPQGGRSSPRGGGSSPQGGRSSPRARSSPEPTGSKSPLKVAASPTPATATAPSCTSIVEEQGTCSASTSKDFSLDKTGSFMNQLPPYMFGLTDWEDNDILARVLAESQQEYLDSLKKSS